MFVVSDHKHTIAWSAVRVALVILLGLFAALPLFAGGDGEATSGEIVPYDPEESYEISIGLYGDLEQAYRAVFATPAFKRAFPFVQINFQTSDFDGHHNRLTVVLAADEATNDIEAIEIAYIAQFVEGGGLTNLAAPPFNGAEAAVPLVDFAVANVTSSSGQLVAMPVDIAPVVLFYREQIAAEAGVSPEEIESMDDWDDFVSIGRRLTRDTDGDGEIDRWAIAHANDVALIPLNGGKTGWYGDNGRPLEPRERFVGALQTVQDVRSSGIDADIGVFSGPGMSALSDGTVAMLAWGSWFGGALREWVAPDVPDWRVTYLPGRASATIGGTFLAIPQRVPAEKKDLAYRIIKFIATNPDAQRIIFRTIEAFPVLTTIYDDPMMSEPVEYFGGEPVRQIYADVARSMPTTAVNPNDPLIEGIWGSAVSSLLEGEATVEEAYEQAMNQVLATVD